METLHIKCTNVNNNPLKTHVVFKILKLLFVGTNINKLIASLQKYYYIWHCIHLVFLHVYWQYSIKLSDKRYLMTSRVERLDVLSSGSHPELAFSNYDDSFEMYLFLHVINVLSSRVGWFPVWYLWFVGCCVYFLWFFLWPLVGWRVGYPLN